jgi:uncharacterized protein (TIGR01777 family)
MRILITGGTGLIGSKLSQDLVEDGHEVIVLSRNPAQRTVPPAVRAEKWDAGSAAGWGHLADGADAIVNLAGAGIAGDGFPPKRWTPERKHLIRDSRLNAGKAVVEAVEAADAKPRVVVQASAVGYYGPRGDEIVTEETPPGSDFLADVCLDWEAATAAVEQMGVRRVVIRSGIVLSTEGGAFPQMMLPFKFFVGGPLGSGRQWQPWIHIADEARAIRFLIEKEAARGPFNVMAPNPVRNKEFARVLGQVLNRPSFIPAPAFALRLAFGEVATTLLDGQRAIPQRLEDLGFTFRYPQLRPALEALLK